MKKIFIAFALLFLAITSCEKEESPPKIVPSNPNQPIVN